MAIGLPSVLHNGFQPSPGPIAEPCLEPALGLTLTLTSGPALSRAKAREATSLLVGGWSGCPCQGNIAPGPGAPHAVPMGPRGVRLAPALLSSAPAQLQPRSTLSRACPWRPDLDLLGGWCTQATAAIVN
jgi:hypothetical protein